MSSAWDDGYKAALNQLKARVQADNPKPTLGIKKVLNHIQDLLGRCANCGGWIYNDGSCYTCEQARGQLK